MVVHTNEGRTIELICITIKYWLLIGCGLYERPILLLQLMENYKKSKVQIDGRPTLEFLRKHHSKPFQDTTHADMTAPTSPRYLPDLSAGEEETVAEALNVDNTYVPQDPCPIHEECLMRCLNPDEVCGALLFKCEKPNCAVFYTSDSHQDVCHQLGQAIHPTIRESLFHGTLKCDCNYTPRMKLSRSDKNFGRVFLTCFKKTKPCRYFQWIHWKVRPPQGPMDAFVQKPPRGRLYYTRGLPTEVQRQDQALQRARQTSQQMICAHPADRFKKDNVRMLSPKPWGNISQQGGFVPSPEYRADEFKRGLYIGNKSFADDFFGPSSSHFTAVNY